MRHVYVAADTLEEFLPPVGKWNGNTSFKMVFYTCRFFLSNSLTNNFVRHQGCLFSQFKILNELIDKTSGPKLLKLKTALHNCLKGLC